jgi:hypothetical protein
MTRGLSALFVLVAVSANADVSCVKGDADVSLIAAGQYVSDAAAPGGRAELRIIRAARCVLPAGTRVEVVLRGEDLTTVEVTDGPSQGCVGEIEAAHLARCEAPAEIARPAVEVEPVERTVVAPVEVGSVLKIGNTAPAGPRIAKWKTPDGRTYFGEKPPRGSVEIGAVEGVGSESSLLAAAPTEARLIVTAMNSNPVVGQDSAALVAGR